MICKRIIYILPIYVGEFKGTVIGDFRTSHGETGYNGEIYLEMAFINLWHVAFSIMRDEAHDLEL